MIGILQAQDGAGMTENLQVIRRMKMSLQFIIGSCDRAGAVYHADPEDTGGDESGQGNPEY